MTLRVTLVESAPRNSGGSMPRYADLLASALENVPGLECRRVSLGLDSGRLKYLPRRLQMMVHHAVVAWRAASVTTIAPADLYHVVDGSHGYIVNRLLAAKTVVTAHDLIPTRQSQGYFPLRPPGKVARWVIQSSLFGLSCSVRVMAVSQSTANDVERFAKVPADQISVVPLTISPSVLPSAEDYFNNWEERRTRSEAFLLHVGNNGFYKNRAGVVRIFDLVQRQVPVRLVLAGPPPDDVLRALIRERHLESLVDFVVDPDDAAIVALYRSARLLLFPSLYEGFGWPTLEAMAWHCPVVCSDCGSLPEVVGEAALVADAADEQLLADHCVSILKSREIADRLVEEGLRRVATFSMDRFRSQLLQVYRSVCANMDFTNGTPRLLTEPAPTSLVGYPTASVELEH